MYHHIDDRILQYELFSINWLQLCHHHDHYNSNDDCDNNYHQDEDEYDKAISYETNISNKKKKKSNSCSSSNNLSPLHEFILLLLNPIHAPKACSHVLIRIFFQIFLQTIITVPSSSSSSSSFANAAATAAGTTSTMRDIHRKIKKVHGTTVTSTKTTKAMTSMNRILGWSPPQWLLLPSINHLCISRAKAFIHRQLLIFVF